MEIKFFCPQWGSKHLDFNEFVTNVKNSGYDGVEMSLPLDHVEKEFIVKAVKNRGLSHIAQHWETVTTDFQ